MALHNTSDRYQYIYGNNVRQIEKEDRQYKTRETGTAVKTDNKTLTPGYAKPAGKTSAAERARLRRTHEKAQDFDWKSMVVALTALVIILASAVFYVQGRVNLYALSNEVSELKTKKGEEMSRQAALQTEIDKSINLDEIRAFAEKELHMVYPDQKHVIYFTDSTDDYFRQYESVDVKK